MLWPAAPLDVASAHAGVGRGAKGPVFNFQQILGGSLESRVLINTRVNYWFWLSRNNLLFPTSLREPRDSTAPRNPSRLFSSSSSSSSCRAPLAPTAPRRHPRPRTPNPTHPYTLWEIPGRICNPIIVSVNLLDHWYVHYLKKLISDTHIRNFALRCSRKRISMDNLMCMVRLIRGIWFEGVRVNLEYDLKVLLCVSGYEIEFILVERNVDSLEV
jgi:hypothetical protein